MKKISVIILFLFSIAGCNIHTKPLYIATSHPVRAILEEITSAEAEIITLVSPGNSPHTYSPKPSQVYKAQKAEAFFPDFRTF